MPIILIPIITVIINDFLKVIIKFIKTKKFDIKRMFKSWGMPSGHTSFVSSAMTITFLEIWPGSIEFMLATVFWVLFMHDARWLRRKAWSHAKILNTIQNHTKLDELIWHTSLEVIVWAFLWMIISFFLWKTWLFAVTNF